jgi:hypothetical protein
MLLFAAIELLLRATRVGSRTAYSSFQAPHPTAPAARILASFSGFSGI